MFKGENSARVIKYILTVQMIHFNTFHMKKTSM